MTPPPEYLQWRLDLFDELKKKEEEELAAKPRSPIQVTLPDGKVIDGTAWETTAMDIAKGLSKSLAERTVIAKVRTNSPPSIASHLHSFHKKTIDFLPVFNALGSFH